MWSLGFIVGRWAGEQITWSTGVLPSALARHSSLMIWKARQPGQRRQGELFSACHAFGGAAAALGNDATLGARLNPLRRPPVLRDPIPEDIL